MTGVRYGPQRYPLSPWSVINHEDLMAKGPPELVRHLLSQRQLGCHVRGQYVETLGMLALRCDAGGVPLGAALAGWPARLDADAVSGWPMARVLP